MCKRASFEVDSHHASRRVLVQASCCRQCDRRSRRCRVFACLTLSHKSRDSKHSRTRSSFSNGYERFCVQCAFALHSFSGSLAPFSGILTVDHTPSSPNCHLTPLVRILFIVSSCARVSTGDGGDNQLGCVPPRGTHNLPLSCRFSSRKTMTAHFLSCSLHNSRLLLLLPPPPSSSSSSIPLTPSHRLNA